MHLSRFSGRSAGAAGAALAIVLALPAALTGPAAAEGHRDADGTVTVTDSPHDHYGTHFGIADLTAVTTSLDRNALHLRLRFTDATDLPATRIRIPIDVDRNTATGSWRSPFGTVDPGFGADRYVWIGHLTGGSVSARVLDAAYTEELGRGTVAVYGRTVVVDVPLYLLGPGRNGGVNLAVHAFTRGTGDRVPDAGAITTCPPSD